jgi:PAS domain S-box-containing protein
MSWQAHSIAVLLLISAGISYALMFLVRQQRSKPGATPFAWMLASATVWSACSAFVYLSPEVTGKILFSKFEYLGVTSFPVFWLLFTLEYSQQNKWMGERSQHFLRILLWIFPAITTLLVFTNEWHGLIWKNVSPVSSAHYAFAIFEHGRWFIVHTIYSYVLLLAGTILLLQAVTRFPGAYRRQTVAIVAGLAIPWIANGLYLIGLIPIPGLDPTPIAFIITGAIYTWGVFHSHWFNLLPVALDSLVASFPDGVVVLDEEQNTLYRNPAAMEVLNAKQVIGQKAEAIFAAYPKIPELCQREGKVHEEIWGSEKPKRCLDIYIDRLEDHSGRPAGRLVVLRDITERKRIEEQMRLQSVALEAAASSVVITDREGIINWINPAFTQTTGYNSEEAIGKHTRILKSGEQDPAFYTDLWNTILEGRNWHGELINRSKDGNRFIEYMTIAPVKDEEGQISHFIAIKQDITRRKELERLRDDLTNALVHDLRSPLNAILASLDTFNRITRDRELPEGPREMLQIGRDSAWRMMGMVNAILDTVRMEAGKLPIHADEVNLAQVAEQIVRLETPLANMGEVLLLVDVPFTLPPVLIDATLVARVLQNLLDNAIKFTPPGGCVQVKAYLDPATSMVIVAVQDGGSGIPPNMSARLFDKFAVGDSPRRGTGLGLAFCRLAVEAHGGKIWVESEPGQGAAFLFTLPVVKKENQPHEDQPESSIINL